MKEPIEVVCPKCNAGVGGKCLDRGPGGIGQKWVETFHSERLDKAKESA